jgi:hypothetical protein
MLCVRLPKTPHCSRKSAHVCVGDSQVLGVLLRHKAAYSAGTLLMWTLQRPQLIDMDFSELSTIAGLMYQSSYCVTVLAVAFNAATRDNSSNSSRSIGTYAAAMTQQLEQSGECHLSLHWATSAAPVQSIWHHSVSQGQKYNQSTILQTSTPCILFGQ